MLETEVDDIEVKESEETETEHIKTGDAPSGKSESNNSEPNNSESNNSEPNNSESNNSEPNNSESNNSEPNNSEPNNSESNNSEPSDSEPNNSEPSKSESDSIKPTKKLDLNTRRIETVIDVLKKSGARRVLDIGCGEGKLLSKLLRDAHFTNIAGVDVSYSVLERAKENLKLERQGEYLRNKIQLFQGSLTYKDSRFMGYDAVCVIEVVEHLDRSRIAAFERVLFEFAKPPVVILTTPNKEYNVKYTSLYDDMLRHGDHRFEWTREEFFDWSDKIAAKFGYQVQFLEIGDRDEEYGTPTQMGVFRKCE